MAKTIVATLKDEQGTLVIVENARRVSKVAIRRPHSPLQHAADGVRILSW